MDNETWKSRFREGASSLGLELPEQAAERLFWFASELLKWNEKINLTAITDPMDVLEKHVLDSLCVLPALEGIGGLLDLGAGAGFPGVPLALARESLHATLVDSVAKKVGFLKHAVAQLGLAPRVKALHVTLAGHPAREGLAPAEAVVSRAFMDVPVFLKFAEPYVQPGGRVIAMASSQQAAAAEGWEGSGWVVAHRWDVTLPFSGTRRSVLAFRRSVDAAP